MWETGRWAEEGSPADATFLRPSNGGRTGSGPCARGLADPQQSHAIQRISVGCGVVVERSIGAPWRRRAAYSRTGMDDRVSPDGHGDASPPIDDEPMNRVVSCFETEGGSRTEEPRPDCLLLLGDQVYADEVSPATRDFMRSRRELSEPPGEEVLDFEEYTRLSREAWGDEDIRRLLATVPSTMILDDHDVHDDWNTLIAQWQDPFRPRRTAA